MWCVQLCSLFLLAVANIEESATNTPKKANVVTSSTTPPSAIPDPPVATSPTATTVSIGMQNFIEPIFMAHAAIKDSLPLDQISLEPLNEVFRWAPAAGNQAYEQLATAYETHGPTVKQAVYESLASCEVYAAEGKKFGKQIYTENLGPHLDPHMATAHDLYATNVRDHVDTTFQLYADMRPVVLKYAFDAYDVATSSLAAGFGEFNDQLFVNVLPATQIGAERTFLEIKTKASILFQPIEVPIGDKKLLFPYGVFDVAFVSMHLLIVLCVGLYTAVALFRFFARFSSRFVQQLFRWTYTAIKSIFSLAYLLVVKITLGLLFFLLRILTLNYLCKCCGFCAQRKKPVKVKATLKQPESKQKAVSESKSTVKKPDSASPPSQPSKSKKVQAKGGGH